MMERLEKMDFQKNSQKCVKTKQTKQKQKNQGEIRTCPKIAAQPAVTSEKGVVNPVRSGSGSGDKSVAENFLRICSAWAES